MYKDVVCSFCLFLCSVIFHPFAFPSRTLADSSEKYFGKAWFHRRGKTPRRLCIAWWLKRNKANGKVAMWKFFLLPARIFAQKVGAIDGASSGARVTFSSVNCGMDIVKIQMTIRAPFSLCIFLAARFQFSIRAQPSDGHAPKLVVKWLKTVYIIPSTLSSNGEFVKSLSGRRSRAISKAPRLARAVANSKIYFHLLPTENSFSPRFSFLQLFCSPLMCWLWK